MAELNVPALALLLPAVLAGGWWGWRRSWRQETLTGLVLTVALVGLDRLVSFLPAVLRAVTRLLARLTSALHMHAPSAQKMVERLPATLIVVGTAVGLILLAYWLGWLPRQAEPGGRASQLASALLGGLNAFLVVAILAEAAAIALGPRLHRLLLAPGSGHGVVIRVPALPSAQFLAEWSAYAMVVLVMAACCWAVTQLPRLRG